MSTTLYIKNMVCLRCQIAVQAVLDAHHIPYTRVELGWAQVQGTLSAAQQAAVDNSLRQYRLELMQDKTAILMERVKTEIVKLLQDPSLMQLKLSAHLSEVLGHNYTYLANTFSEKEGITLERYFIAQRVERAKELMVYEDLSLSQLTDALRYSSVSHLCQQFKKVTGITPAEFKKQWQEGPYVWRPLNAVNR